MSWRVSVKGADRSSLVKAQKTRTHKNDRTSFKEPAGIFLNFSQACQNKMFSALTSDLRKVCGERNAARVNTSGTARQKHHVKLLLFCSWACWESQHDARSSAAHREVLDSTGVLQQLLEGHGPAQHSVHRAGLPARGSWKAGAAASAAPCRHVQFCSTSQGTSTPIYQQANIDWQRD